MCAGASLPEKEAKHADVEEEKLRLEIVNLRKRNKWWAQPIWSVLVAVIGLFLTFVGIEIQRSTEQQRFISEQQEARKKREVDQWNRSQDQIRADIDEILRFPKDQSQSTARISLLLEDIKTILNSYMNERQRVSDLFPGFEQRLSTRLVLLVRDDCDLSKTRDVVLANTLIARWDDYSNYLKNEPDKLNYILDKYLSALQGFRDQNPGYLEEMRLDKSNRYVISSKYDRRKDEPLLFDHFLSLIEGFQMHLEAFGKVNLSEKARSLKEINLCLFQSTLRNRTISEHVFPDEHCADGR